MAGRSAIRFNLFRFKRLRNVSTQCEYASEPGSELILPGDNFIFEESAQADHGGVMAGWSLHLCYLEGFAGLTHERED